jgi:hypothetical protein
VQITGDDSTSASVYVPVILANVNTDVYVPPVTPYQVKVGHFYTVACYPGQYASRQLLCPVTHGNLVTAVTNIGSVSMGLADNISGPALFKFDMGYQFVTNVVASGGAAPASGTVNALDIFYGGLVADGIDTKFLSINAFAPDNLNAGVMPFIYYKGLKPWTSHNFVGGDLTVNGLTGNGSTKYMECGWNPNTIFGASTSSGMSGYGYVSAGNSGYLATTISGSTVFYIDAKFTDLNGYSGNSQDTVTVVPSPGNGFFSMNRTGANTHVLYFANSGTGWASVGSSAGVAFTSYPTQAAFILARNNNGATDGYSSSTLSYISLHTGLSSADGQKEYNRVQTLRTSLGGGFR